MKRLAVLGVAALLLMCSGASVAVAAGADQYWDSGTLVGLHEFPGIGGFYGTSGSWAGHLVFQPVVVPDPEQAPPHGVKEDSRFTISGFTGSVCFDSPLGLLCATADSVDAMVSVHFGDEPNKPVATVLVTSGDICLGSCLVSPPIKLLKVVGGVPVVLFK